MGQLFLTVARPDAASHLAAGKGAELISCFRSLPWEAFLAGHLDNLSNATLLALLEELKSAISGPHGDMIVIPPSDSDKNLFVDELRSVYILRSGVERSAAEVVDDVLRAWSARADESEGRVAVAFELDPVGIQDNPQKASLPISRALDNMGLTFSKLERGPETRENSLQSGSSLLSLFLGFSRSGKAMFQSLLYRGSWVAILRRIFPPVCLFRNAWTDAEVKELGTCEASNLPRFLSTEGTPVSPSQTTCKRHLCSLLLNAPTPTNQNRRSVSILTEPKDVEVAPERTRPAPLRLAEVPEDSAAMLGESFLEPSFRPETVSFYAPTPAHLCSLCGWGAIHF